MPIPTSTELFATAPMTMALLSVTTEFAPIAVEFEMVAAFAPPVFEL